MQMHAPHHLILLVGMMCDDRLFGHQIRYVKEASQDQLDISVPALDTAASLSEMASQILADAPPFFALAGLSMGGILAMEIMAQAPHRIQRLALMDTNPFAETPEGILRRNRQIEDVQNGGLKQVIADEMKPHYLAETKQKDMLLDLCMNMAVSVGAQAFIRQSQALRDRPDHTKTLAKVRCPTLILHGAEDRLCPPERHIYMKSLMPHATLVQIDKAGHLPPLEAPDKTSQHLWDWVR